MFIIRKNDKKKPKIPKMPKFDDKKIADKKPSEKDWKYIHNAADGQVDKMINKIEKVVEDTKKNTKKNKLIDGIRYNDPYLMYASIPFDDFDNGINALTDFIKVSFDLAGEQMIINLPKKYSDFKFDSTTPRAIEFVKKKGADLVVEIGDSTKNAIKKEMDKALKEGLGVDVTAKNITNLIGLTERQAEAVTKYRQRLIEAGLSNSKIENYSKKYAKRLLNYRTENIARTELMSAANQGHLEMINQVVEEGLVDAEEIKRIWIVTPDDRLCEYCRQMDNQVTDLNGYFYSELGQFISPPLHPQCRCVTGVKF